MSEYYLFVTSQGEPKRVNRLEDVGEGIEYCKRNGENVIYTHNGSSWTIPIPVDIAEDDNAVLRAIEVHKSRHAKDVVRIEDIPVAADPPSDVTSTPLATSSTSAEPVAAAVVAVSTASANDDFYRGEFARLRRDLSDNSNRCSVLENNTREYATTHIKLDSLVAKIASLEAKNAALVGSVAQQGEMIAKLREIVNTQSTCLRELVKQHTPSATTSE